MIKCPGNIAHSFEELILIRAQKYNFNVKAYAGSKNYHLTHKGHVLSLCRIYFDTWEEGEFLKKVKDDYLKKNPEVLNNHPECREDI